MRSSGIGVVASDAFTTSDDVPEAVRVCLGGPITRPRLVAGLEYMAHALTEGPALVSGILVSNLRVIGQRSCGAWQSALGGHVGRLTFHGTTRFVVAGSPAGGSDD